MYVYEDRLHEYLDWMEWEMLMQIYEVWRHAYGRGLVTAAELSRFLTVYERDTEKLR